MLTREEEAQHAVIARNAAYKAPGEASRLIVELGQERLRALQAGGIALDARTTQVAAFQMAAAAFSATFSVQEKAPPVTAVLAGVGCLAFIAGSALAFWGIRSCTSQVAGVDPSFWHGILSTPRFTDKLARAWAAQVTQEMIDHARRVDDVRGRWLDRSLLSGSLGAILVLLAVVGRALPADPPKSPKTPFAVSAARSPVPAAAPSHTGSHIEHKATPAPISDKAKAAPPPPRLVTAPQKAGDKR